MAERKWLPTILITAILVVLGIGYFISTAAQLRLFESIICKNYYLDRPDILNLHPEDIPENLCKIVKIQEDVAELVGWQSFFEGLPGLILVIPYGVVADRLGRRPVLVASMLGMFLWSVWIVFVCWSGMAIQLVWLSSAFLIIGGGSPVAAAISMTILTAATPEAQRSRTFFYSEALLIAVGLAFPPVGAHLMEQSVWAPLIIQLLCSVSAIFLAFLVPEPEVESADVLQSAEEDFEHGSTTGDDDGLKLTKQMESSSTSLLSHCLKTANFMAHERNKIFLLLTFPLNSFAMQSLSVILQYISQRFKWGLAETSYILSFRSGIQLFFFVAILPGLDFALYRWSDVSPQNKDLTLARLSICILAVSLAMVSLSYEAWTAVLGLAFYTLGSGFGTFSRSLISSLVHPDMLGSLYTTLSLVEAGGTLLAGPIIAKTFKLGMHLGGVWVGLPYMISAALLFICVISMLLVDLPIRDDDQIAYHRVNSGEGDGQDAMDDRGLMK